MVEFKGSMRSRWIISRTFIISSNHDWVVPAGHEARRFFVLDVGDDHREDHDYFAAIEAQMANGGSAALLYELLHHDCRGVNLRLVPKTDALMDQKSWGCRRVEKWWLECLVRGEQVYEGWQTVLTTSEVYEAYIHHAGKAGVNGRERRWSWQVNCLGWCRDKEGSAMGQHAMAENRVATAGRSWTLLTCRKAFDTRMHWTYEWEEIETDQDRP